MNFYWKDKRDQVSHLRKLYPNLMPTELHSYLPAVEMYQLL